jgi:hypothetical protein
VLLELADEPLPHGGTKKKGNTFLKNKVSEARDDAAAA